MVIPGPSEGRSPEPMHTGLWKMVSGLGATGGEGDARLGYQIIALFASYNKPLTFENELRTGRRRCGLPQKAFTRPPQGGECSTWRRNFAVHSLQMQPRAVAYTTADIRS